MASLTKAFNDFIGRLPPTPGQAPQSSNRSQRLVRMLQSTWGEDKMRAIGSVSRGTHVPPKRDVDWMIVLDPAKLEDKDANQVLDKVQEAIRPSHGDDLFSARSRSVGITYPELGIVVVPAFPRAEGGYRIPDVATGTWIHTNPLKHGDLVKEKNQATDGMAAAIVRTLAVWNRNGGYGLRSFHLEVMTLRGIVSTPSSLIVGVVDAFKHVAGAVMGPCEDPAESGTRLDEYLDTPKKREAIANVSARAVSEIEQAVAEDANGDSWRAVDRVRRLLGSPF